VAASDGNRCNVSDAAEQVQLMRTRDRAAELDFSEVLGEEVESEMKEAAAISMGTDISESDILNILALCEQVRLRTTAVSVFSLAGPRTALGQDAFSGCPS
jgi:hypothetical protein